MNTLYYVNELYSVNEHLYSVNEHIVLCKWTVNEHIL